MSDVCNTSNPAQNSNNIASNQRSRASSTQHCGQLQSVYRALVFFWIRTFVQKSEEGGWRASLSQRSRQSTTVALCMTGMPHPCAVVVPCEGCAGKHSCAAVHALHQLQRCSQWHALHEFEDPSTTAASRRTSFHGCRERTRLELRHAERPVWRGDNAQCRCANQHA